MSSHERRARVNAEMGAPPTIAEQTAQREARTASALAETRALLDRTWRREAQRRSPDWWMYTDKHPYRGDVLVPPPAKPKTYSL